MSFDILGLGVLFLVTLVVSVIQGGLALAAMFGMHKYLPDKLEEKRYGTFDFDQFQKKDFTDFLTRLAIVFLVPTVVLHLLDYVMIGRQILRHSFLVCALLWVLETGAIAAGLHFIFRLDTFRLAVLTAVSAVVYLLLLWLVLYRYLI